MPVIKQKWITRADLKASPDTLFLFGDNDARRGYGGQAREMRDEPNAIGVRTKWVPVMSQYAFFDDRQFDVVSKMIDEDLEPAREHLRQGGRLVVPEDGLGTGLSQLPERAPVTNAFLCTRLAELETIRSDHDEKHQQPIQA